MKWNDDWRTELKEKNYNCYERLCECRTTLADIKVMAKLMFKYNNKNFTAEECLDRTAEWVCEWNNQFYLFNKIGENYNDIIKGIKRG